ncbi:MAG: hypothetical protein FWG12_08010 [Holophagaceae bacterium]|nr:hypothetical protein [Holophagaceae bacterium]
MQLFQNNYSDVLAAELSASATSLSLTRNDLVEVSDDNFALLTLESTARDAWEIVKVTSHVSGSNTCTIERAQEGTEAQSWPNGNRAELRLTAGTLQRIMAAMENGGIGTGNNGTGGGDGDGGGTGEENPHAGTSWVQQTSVATSALYAVAAHANGQWVIAGDSGVILTSSDTVTWTKRTCPVTTALRSVAAHANGQWVIAGDSGVILASAA